jgi:hypothetical protein
MNTTQALNTPELSSLADLSTLTDLSAGARQHGLRVPVLVDTRLLEDYAPVDPTLGYNTAGALLNLLSYCAAGTRHPERHQELTAALVRRQDGQLVELDIAAVPARCSAGRCLYLHAIAERELAG